MQPGPKKNSNFVWFGLKSAKIQQLSGVFQHFSGENWGKFEIFLSG